MSNSGIHIKKENRGKFTEAAKRRGMGVQEFARQVLANRERYSPTLVKRANFARNAAKWKKQEGGYSGKEANRQYLINWLNSNESRERAKRLGFDSDAAIQNIRLAQINESYLPNELVSPMHIYDPAKKPTASYNMDTNTVKMNANPNYLIEQGYPYGYDSKMIHELSHSAQYGANNKLEIPFKNKRRLNTPSRLWDYFSRGETLPRIMEARFILNLKPSDKVNQKHIDELRSLEKDNMLFKVYDDENLIDVFNEMVSIDSNSEVNKAKEGGYNMSQLNTDFNKDIINNINYGMGGSTVLLSSVMPNELPKLQLKSGGGIPERYKSMGFSKVGQKKKSTRPGKKWMVLAKKGDQYKVVHGGYKGMEDYTQHKDKSRRDKFWNRMGGRDSAKAKDPFSPLYWHKRFGTWQEGGYTYSGKGSSADVSFDPNSSLVISNPFASIKKSYSSFVNPTGYDFEESNKRIKELNDRYNAAKLKSFNTDMSYINKYPDDDFAKQLIDKRLEFIQSPNDTNAKYQVNRILQKGGLAKSQRSLKNWTNQEWMTSGTYSNKTKGKNKEVKSEGKKRYLPKNAWASMSSGEKAATNRAKAEGNAKGKQFVKQPKEIAKKAARFRMEGGFIREVKEGGKIPKNILESRLKKHMSPSEVNNYLSNYKMGGQIIDYKKVDGGYMVKFN